MTTEELTVLFEEHNAEFLKFDRVANARSRRADLHAFLLLDELVPGKADMVSAAEHDVIYLAFEPDDLSAVVTKEQVVELIRCGVMLDEEVDSLSMFT